eukprot:scaffold13341_cov119-Skeletonema_dohrnii-CCMP3373.AAC.2
MLKSKQPKATAPSAITRSQRSRIDRRDCGDGVICSSCKKDIHVNADHILLKPCKCLICTRCLMHEHARRGSQALCCPSCSEKATSHRYHSARTPDEDDTPYKECNEVDNSSNKIIELTEDSSENNDAPQELDDSDDDSSIEIVDASAFQQQQAAAAAAAASNNNGGEDSDEEVQCLGTANETKLPHNRQDCPIFRYKNNKNNSNGTSCCAETTLENARFCELCYCYVCDKPASECTSWYLGEKGVVHQDGNGGPPEDTKQSSSKTDDIEENASLQRYESHCNATGSDKRGTKNVWDKMRAAVKDDRDPSAVTGNNAAARSTAASASAALAGQSRQQGRRPRRFEESQWKRDYWPDTSAGYSSSSDGEENYSRFYGSNDRNSFQEAQLWKPAFGRMLMVVWLMVGRTLLLEQQKTVGAADDIAVVGAATPLLFHLDLHDDSFFLHDMVVVDHRVVVVVDRHAVFASVDNSDSDDHDDRVAAVHHGLVVD